MGKALGNSQAERSDTSTTENRPPMAKVTRFQLVLLAQVRVKRRGKSPPRWWRHHRQGKRRPMQGQIGRHLSKLFGVSATGWPGRGLRVSRLRFEVTRIPEK
jgi:hypothetical protein